MDTKPWLAFFLIVGVGCFLLLTQQIWIPPEHLVAGDSFSAVNPDRATPPNPGEGNASASGSLSDAGDSLPSWKVLHTPLFPPEGKRRGKVGNIVFIKGFKTASTTVASILFRFGFRHGLKFMFTQTSYWGLDPFNDKFPDNPYNIHLQHLTVNLPFENMLSFFRSHISNPQFITTLREPLSQKLSAYNFLWAPNEENRTIEYFIEKNPYRNHQAKALGIKDEDELKKHLSTMEKLFIVLIAEKMEEGLVLMKRKLNWELNDLLFINLLVTCRDNKDQKGLYIPCANRTLLERPDVNKAFKEQTSLDQVLYDHFLRKHIEEVSKQDETFFQEVQDLKKANLWLQNYCSNELQAFMGNQRAYLDSLQPSYCFKYIIHEAGYEKLLRNFDERFFRAFMYESLVPIEPPL